jgi:hypothetical protein
MKMTIYVPDDLAAELRLHPQINVSATCQAALRQELALMGEESNLDAMRRFVVHSHYESPLGAVIGRTEDMEPVFEDKSRLAGSKTAFVGRMVASMHTRGAGTWNAYITKRGWLLVDDLGCGEFYLYDDLKEFRDHWTGSPQGTEEERESFVAEVERAVSRGVVVELDL